MVAKVGKQPTNTWSKVRKKITRQKYYEVLQELYLGGEGQWYEISFKCYDKKAINYWIIIIDSLYKR